MSVDAQPVSRVRQDPYRRTVRLALVPPLIALSALAVVCVWQVGMLLVTVRSVDRVDAVIGAVTRIQKLAVDAETGERGYLVGADPIFLEPYSEAQAALPGAFDDLERLVAGDANATARAESARLAYLDWRRYAEREMALRGQSGGAGTAPSAAFVREYDEARGKTLMDAMRRRVDAFTDEQTRLRALRSREAETANGASFWVGAILTILVALLLGGVTLRQMRRLIRYYETAMESEAWAHDAEQQARERLGTTLTSIGDAVLVTDATGRVTMMNPVAEQLTGWTAAEATGKDSRIVFDIINETSRETVESPVDRVIREGVIVGLANHTLLRRRDGTEIAIDDSGAPVRDAQGSLIGVVLVFRDVTERRKNEIELASAYRREAVVNAVGAAIRDSPLDAEAILRTAVSALGPGLDADRCYYGRYDQQRDYARLGPDWHREGLESIAADYPMSRFAINRDPEYRRGRLQVVEDVRAFAPLGEEAEPGPLESLGLRAIVRVPIQVGNAMTVLAVAMSGGPRRWSRNDLDIIETVGTQVQSALQSARLLAEERARAEREMLLHRIDEAAIHAADPSEVQHAAARALCEALHADRCYFATLDAERGSVVVGEDWCKEGIASLAGQHPATGLGAAVRQMLEDGATMVVGDTRHGPQTVAWPADTVAALSNLHIAALVHVPYSASANLHSALGVAMSETARDWTPDEVDLVEAAAVRIREAVAVARAQQRERTIASQLQRALTPPPPASVPGLALASHYRPALDEAEVGGDFIDVFAIDERSGRTALVVSDLSGKGLAAASQVATVRNMLRALLLDGQPIDRAVTRLNGILDTHRLLVGFATLFVGVFDATAGTLTYVSCGQEPGLIRRAQGETIEELTPTGPILGGFAGATFAERTVAMYPGDVLALFTDGLTEAAPSRRGRLFGVEGVAGLLADADAPGNDAAAAEAVVTHIIAGVDDFARGGVRDDVALLVAVVTGVADGP